MIFRTLRFVPIAVLLALTGLAAPLAHGAANPKAEPDDLDVELLAQIAKERAKGNSQKTAAGRAGDGAAATDKDGCGNIGIGNIFTGGNVGFRPPREVTVIVTGDVISANNRCK